MTTPNQAPVVLSIPTRVDPHLAGIGLMVLAMFMFTVMDTIGKSLTETYAVQQVVWGRYAFHFLFTLALAPWFGVHNLLRTRRPALQIGRGLLLAVATLCMFTALSFLPMAETYTISFTAPLIVAALAVPLLGEQMGWRRWSAVVVGFVGVVIVIRPGLGMTHWAAFMPLVTAVCFALYQILTRRVSADPHESPIAMLFYLAAVGALVLSLIAPLYWRPVAWPDWGWMVAMGALGCLGHLILIRGLSLAPASLLSPFTYTQIVWALLLGWFVFGDLPDAWMLAGCVVIIGSGLFIFWREAASRRR